jgi:hypothetical protein
MTDRFRNLCLAVAVCLSLGGPAATRAQMPIFPGAEGYGGTFSGAAPAGGWLSNATVYHVTNLNDSGAGSFRGAFQENTANRIIVFDVAGTINLTSGAVSIKNLANYYIAGQTAPGPVTIYGNTVQLSHSSGKENRNVALRYLSFRKGTGSGEDALTFSGGGLGTNLILDHVSASWAEDEVLSVANNNTNVTVQYSTIHDALVNNHAYGSLIRPQIDSNVSFHHNLYAHNASRQARFGTYNGETLTADFRNNVIYNWRDRASYTGGSSEAEQEFTDVNYVGNYLIAGPGTTGSATRAFSVDKNVDSRVYQSGNFIDSDKALNPGGVPNGSDLGWAAIQLSTPVTDQTLTQMATPFATAPVTTETAASAYGQVVDHVGNWWWNRDAIDSRVINNVKTNTGPPIGAAAPNATELANLLGTPMTTHSPGWDSDNDGMPNAWELAHGLNPNSPGATPDWKLDFDNDGYINLLEYVNERGEFPAPAPIVFNGGTNSRYAQITNWKTSDGVTAGSNWQPSKYDVAVINNGTVTVDAAGQHAGFLWMAPNAADVATLAVTAGWLAVASEVEYGWAGAGTIEHTGGTMLTPMLRIGPAGVYNLSAGGVLRAGQVLLNEGGQFNFTGGVLDVQDAQFHLVNQGGVISPGAGVGGSNFVALTIESGSLLMELGGAAPGTYDFIGIEWLVAGGMLDVNLIDGYSPALGDSFQLLSFENASGAFNFDLPSLAEGLTWNTDDLLTTGVLSVVSAAGNPADFNNDGIVDGDDLDEWSQNFGATAQPNNSTGDADGDGDVDGGDFLVWQRELGDGANAAIASTSVPEPASWLLGLVASVLLRGYYRVVRVAPATR